MNEISIISIIAISSACGGLIARWHGGAWPGPRGLKNAAWALPFGAGVAWGYWGINPWLAAFVGLSAFALCLAGKATGHGQYINYPKPVTPEKLDFIVRWFFGPDTFTNPYRDAFGLVAVGLAAVSGAVLALIPLNPPAALILTLGGGMKAPAYMIGWRLSDKYPTEIGEVLTGAFAFGTLALAVLI